MRQCHDLHPTTIRTETPIGADAVISRIKRLLIINGAASSKKKWSAPFSSIVLWSESLSRSARGRPVETSITQAQMMSAPVAAAEPGSTS